MSSLIHGKCNTESFLYIIDHVVSRSWNQALIFTPGDAQSQGCTWMLLHLIKCLGINGVAIALNVQSRPHYHNNIGVIILTPEIQNKTVLLEQIKKLNSWDLNTASSDWLIIAKSLNDLTFINRVLNATELRYDQNMVVAFPSKMHRGHLEICKGNFEYQITRNNQQNYYENGKLDNCSELKIRSRKCVENEVGGRWRYEDSMSFVQMPYPVEARNLLGEELIIGRCNYTSDEQPAPGEDGSSAPELLDDLLYFLTVRLNATSTIRYYNKLGFRTYEGAWSGLLGALLDYTVDIALEPVTEQVSCQQEMDFIFPIAETMYNIYIRNQETSSVRDIFLAPFSTRLLVCVAFVIIMAALVIVIITNISRSLLRTKSRAMTCTEALIWSTGILCQQGGTWTPKNPAASILLIVCLFFGLITYNAYAAFITSVLSVRAANVGTVADVLQSPNMKIGYIRNGADQIYLMSTKDVQLNAFYIRGYSEAENLVSSPEEGLERAASQDYAFFAGQRAARLTLMSLSQARGRCLLRELPVHSTRSQLSFPLPRGSPYSRPILLSLLQLRSGGTLSRLTSSLVPALPQCASPSGFASARAADVQTAFVVIITGLTASLFVGLGEYCWKNRKDNWHRIQNYCSQFFEFFR
ncbi:unnamed protein product [Leptosia nina]|uniref:Ionotropic glutamate receptor C-terminal domain-containing protein n=1 Tax=Leptosia nina TaxID=320188 RepID=A0AAV1IVV9_9NEOP